MRPLALFPPTRSIAGQEAKVGVSLSMRRSIGPAQLAMNKANKWTQINCEKASERASEQANRWPTGSTPPWPKRVAHPRR